MNGTPQETKVTAYVGVRLTASEKVSVEEIAFKEGRSASQVGRRAIQQYLKKRKKAA